MKYLLPLVMVFHLAAFSQNKTEKILWLGGAAVGFAAFDYLGYNLTKYEDGRAPVSYRVVQFAVQAGISYLLYKKCGLPTAISFNLIWWTFGEDMLYYGIAELVPDGRFEGRGTWSKIRSVHHAYWTPMGLLHQKPLSKDTVVGQALGGLMLSISIGL